MKRVILLILAGMGLIVACNSDDDYGYGYASPPTAFASSSTSSASSSGTSSSSGRTDTGPTYCADRPYCGARGCCPPSWRCLRDKCVAPGLLCTSDEDCSSDRYCALDLNEPRCYPRETFCEEDGDAGADCINATCGPGPDVHLTTGRASCADVTLYLYNFGRDTLPPGAIIAIDSQPKVKDAGAGDVGDAGDGAKDAGAPPITTVTGTTTDGVLPGEVVLLTIPFDSDYNATLRMRVVHDAGAAASDCDPKNDSDNVYNGCSIPK